MGDSAMHHCPQQMAVSGACLVNTGSLVSSYSFNQVMSCGMCRLSSSGLLPASDWTELSAVWSGCGPVLLHLLAYGLQQLLCGAVGLVARACHTCRCWGRGFSWLLLVTSVLPILFCSAGSLLLASSALLLQVQTISLLTPSC